MGIFISLTNMFRLPRVQRPLASRRLLVEALEDRLCPSYTTIDLGTLGGVSSSTTAINESGQVIGYAATSAGQSHPFLWQNGTMTDLTAHGITGATDINDAGDIVGRYLPAGSTFYRAALLQAGVVIDLGTLGGDSSSASAINNSGQIVGSSRTADNDYRPFVWEGGVMYDLQNLLPANSGWDLGDTDINDNGQIAGSGLLNGERRAFLISDPDGIFGNGGATITNLGVLPSGVQSYAEDINNLGQVTGFSSAKWGENHAFVYKNGAMTDIKTLGGPLAYTSAINDNTQIVGRSLTQRLNYDDDNHAFLWQNGKMTDLNKFRPRGSAGTLEHASDINNAGLIVGQIRFGQTYMSGTYYHAFLMVPGSPLQAESVSTEPVTQIIDMDQVQPLLEEAILRWHAAGADISFLKSIDIRIADLPGTTLGLASGNTIWLDANAAGWGWFVDSTPWDDSEFLTRGDQGEEKRMDLLTVLEHEMGHILGLDHDEGGVMGETLAAGDRLTAQRRPSRIAK